MKGMKKLLSILMVLTLVLSLGASALAAKVTIDEQGGNDTGSTYSAYKLFDATYERTEGTKDIYKYTLNVDFAAAIKAGLDAAKPGHGLTVDAANESKVIAAISAMNVDEIRKFADAAYKKILEDKTAASETSTGNVFNDLSGYVLIAETVGTGDNAVASLVMLDTAGKEEITIKDKENVPSSEKKVKEKNDTTGVGTAWQDAADYDIGDHVPFQLTGTLPDDYDTYDSYKIVFHDTEGTGLTFDKDSVKVSFNGLNIESKDFASNGIVVHTLGDGISDGCTFEIEITDVKTTFRGATNGSVITVEYTSTLNDGAAIGSEGNPNEMYMEYTNDHYSEGTGKTPKDKVKVFTFEIKANKVDQDEEPLEGAGFTLLKEVPDDAAGSFTSVADYKALGGQSKDAYVEYGGKHYQVVGAQITGKTSFEFKGEDSGKYLLVETTVPTNYNKADDIAFEVKAEYDTNSNDPNLTKLEIDPADGTFKATLENGTIEGTIKNQMGVELPSTGGIGTTIFYVAGAILVAGAAILLVTKKRVNGADK